MTDHLFIQDVNRSPFNVGRKINLVDFDLQQTIDLNARYGSPLTTYSESEALYALIAGQAFLTRAALDERLYMRFCLRPQFPRTTPTTGCLRRASSDRMATGTLYSGAGCIGRIYRGCWEVEIAGMQLVVYA